MPFIFATLGARGAAVVEVATAVLCCAGKVADRYLWFIDSLELLSNLQMNIMLVLVTVKVMHTITKL